MTKFLPDATYDQLVDQLANSQADHGDGLEARSRVVTLLCEVADVLPERVHEHVEELQREV